MSQSQVPTAHSLDILTEIVTDTGAAAPSATAQMQAMLGELDKDAAQSVLIIGSAGRSSPAEPRTTLQTPGTSSFNQMTTNLQLCLDQASSRSESAAFLL